MQFDFPALGTHWWIEIFDESHRESPSVRDRIVGFVAQFEVKYSRFLPDSLISQLNRARSLVLDDESLKLLRYGVDVFNRTDGIFNILVGHILQARGYDQQYSLTDSGSHVLLAGDPNVDITFDDNTVRLGNGDIDIGGFGKGWLIDLLATELRELGFEQFLINGGGDIYVTHHHGEPLKIFLEDPLNNGEIIGSIRLKNRAFAASSPHKRAWPIKEYVDGSEQIRNQNHIVSRSPIRDVVYLTAPSAAEADTFATTLLQTDTDRANTLAAQNGITLIHQP